YITTSCIVSQHDIENMKKNINKLVTLLIEYLDKQYKRHINEKHGGKNEINVQYMTRKLSRSWYPPRLVCSSTGNPNTCNTRYYSSLHLHSKDRSFFSLTSMVIVQSILADFFFFMINISSTFPVILAVLLRVKVPEVNSLPRLAVFGSWLELKFTTTLIFLVDFNPAFPLGMTTCPMVAPP
ncbi:hypothetical protein PanWU01x14_301410, partial [Parasponia andersonii]